MRSFTWIFCLSLLASCAQILSPNGGEKDVTPPVCVRYLPDSAATHFTGNKIILRFDEYVQLGDIQNQLIISPPLSHQPDVNIRHKDIVITINDTLQSNTTYSLSFGNSIKDITESNVLDNFRYVFSTGPVIDSIHLAGRLINANTLNAEGGILVMLYNTMDDSAPYTKRPYYFTKTKADGTFLITNIRAGSYKIFALDDKNQNYKYDDAEERIAFRNQTLQLDRNVDTLKLSLFKEIPKKQKRGKFTYASRGHISLTYSMPNNELSLPIQTDAEELKGLLIEKNSTNDTIDIWFNTFNHDSIVIPVFDGKKKIDSASFKIIKENSAHGKSGGAGIVKPLFTSNIVPGVNYDPLKHIMIYSSIPIKNYSSTGILLTKGKDTVKTTFDFSNAHTLVCSSELLSDSAYTLFVKPATLTDWFGQTNDTMLFKFKVESAEHYGVLKVNLNGIPGGNYILQLLNEKEQPIQQMELNGRTNVAFEHLSPGQYRLKLILDENKNGKWDTGNYNLKKQPEQVFYYTAPIRMRAGWDMDIDWKFR